MAQKTCKKCLIGKSEVEFSRHRTECKQCIKIYNKFYYNKNKEKIQKQLKEYYLKNREKSNERSYSWRKRNKDKVSQYRRNKLNSDPIERIKANLRSRLYHSLKNNVKYCSAVNDLGCTIEYLRQYLQSKFQEGMSWDNYGLKGWEIDHIRPLSSFKLDNKDELLRAIHYTNLQPMWVSDNRRKKDKIIIEVNR